MKFSRITYSSLNSRQRENYNFQKASAVLADYGFVTLRLSADWQGADFIAQHVDGDLFLKVQLKGRPIVDTKYKAKGIWICFRRDGTWYLYPHDSFLKWALRNTTIARTSGWKRTKDWDRVSGVYSWPSPSKQIMAWMRQYALGGEPS
jgi:hypothetical protein